MEAGTAKARTLPAKTAPGACVNVSIWVPNIWITFDKLTIDFYFAAGLHSIVLYGTEPPTEVSDNSGVPVDVSLWIGLLVALVVFIVAFLIIVKMMLRKKRLPPAGYTLTTGGGTYENFGQISKITVVKMGVTEILLWDVDKRDFDVELSSQNLLF